jgi:large subunit ribosomal protein L19e
MALTTVKRLAADIMKIGVNKVRIAPESIGRANEAITRNDVRDLIKDGVVYRAEIEGRRSNSEKRGRKGHGKRKGRKNARTNAKDAWMARVRSQRAYLKQLVSEGKLPKEYKRETYMRVKSGIFKSKKAMYAYLKENNKVKE